MAFRFTIIGFCIMNNVFSAYDLYVILIVDNDAHAVHLADLATYGFVQHVMQSSSTHKNGHTLDLVITRKETIPSVTYISAV